MTASLRMTNPLVQSLFASIIAHEIEHTQGANEREALSVQLQAFTEAFRGTEFFQRFWQAYTHQARTLWSFSSNAFATLLSLGERFIPRVSLIRIPSSLVSSGVALAPGGEIASSLPVQNFLSLAGLPWTIPGTPVPLVTGTSSPDGVSRALRGTYQVEVLHLAGMIEDRNGELEWSPGFEHFPDRTLGIFRHHHPGKTTRLNEDSQPDPLTIIYMVPEGTDRDALERFLENNPSLRSGKILTAPPQRGTLDAGVCLKKVEEALGFKNASVSYNFLTSRDAVFTDPEHFQGRASVHKNLSGDWAVALALILLPGLNPEERSTLVTSILKAIGEPSGDFRRFLDRVQEDLNNPAHLINWDTRGFDLRPPELNQVLREAGTILVQA